jgi:hypothetical protein
MFAHKGSFRENHRLDNVELAIREDRIIVPSKVFPLEELEWPLREILTAF